MTVYVDDGFCGGGPNAWGQWTGGGHMQADTEEELHKFAKKLGLKRSWFQPGSRPEAAHYDLVKSKRDRAISLGAVSETWREASRRRRPSRN